MDEGLRINPQGDEEEVPARGPEVDDEDDETLNELAQELLNFIDLDSSLLGLDENVDMGAVSGAAEGGVSRGQLPNTIARNRQSRKLSAPVLTRGTERGDGQPVDNDLEGSGMHSVRAEGPELSRAKSKLKGNSMGEPSKHTTKDDEAQRSGLEHGVSVDESFTGTGAIAIVPYAHEFVSDEEEDEENQDKESKKTENIMNRKPALNEDGLSKSPSGGPAMDSPSGQGVANKSAKQETVGQYDTNTKSHGEAWPRQHNETAAMCDVDENGVEGKPQGVHVSSSGKPDDGHQSAVGHDWPAEPKSSGGAHEAAGGAGHMSGGHSSDVSESAWTPELFGKMMSEDDMNLQTLFDSYAKDVTLVCLEDFKTLCNVHGSDVVLDHRSLENLMEANQDFIFYQGEDADGLYWTPTPFAQRSLNEATAISENCGACECDPCECCDKCTSSPCCCESVNEAQISEVQHRSGEEETDWGQPERGGNLGAGDPHALPGEFPDTPYDDLLGLGATAAAGHAPGPHSMFGSDYECADCGTVGPEQVCPDCGAELGGGEEIAFGGQMDQGLSDYQEYGYGDDRDEFDMSVDVDDGFPVESKTVVTGPAMVEAVKSFLSAANDILEFSDSTADDIAEALNHSWLHYARNVNPAQCPSKVKKSLVRLSERFPGFLAEHAMDNLGGNPIGGKKRSGNKSSWLSEEDNPGPDDMKQLGSKENPLARNPVNTHEKTPVVAGTEKSGGSVKESSSAIQKNISRLATYTKKAIKEAAKRFRGKYDLTFSVVVNEGEGKVKTPVRSQLSEALADTEEILQFHNPADVALETNFCDSTGCTVFHTNIPMIKIDHRGPMFAEGKILFRFNKNAENFANELVAEGKTCKITDHNWGRAVAANVSRKVAIECFASAK